MKKTYNDGSGSQDVAKESFAAERTGYKTNMNANKMEQGTEGKGDKDHGQTWFRLRFFYPTPGSLVPPYSISCSSASCSFYLPSPRWNLSSVTFSVPATLRPDRPLSPRSSSPRRREYSYTSMAMGRPPQIPLPSLQPYKTNFAVTVQNLQVLQIPKAIIYSIRSFWRLESFA